MLQDRVNNQLTVLVGVAELRGAGSHSAQSEDDVETAMTAARAVSQELESLSLESLRAWESRYARHLPSSAALIPVSNLRVLHAPAAVCHGGRAGAAAGRRPDAHGPYGSTSDEHGRTGYCWRVA